MSEGVLQKVCYHAGERVGCGEHGHGLAETHIRLPVAHGEGLVADRERVRHRGGEIARRKLRLPGRVCRAGVREEVVHEHAHGGEALLGALEVAGHALRVLRALGELQVALRPGERGADVMGERGELLAEALVGATALKVALEVRVQVAVNRAGERRHRGIRGLQARTRGGSHRRAVQQLRQPRQVAVASPVQRKGAHVTPSFSP